MRKKHDTPTPSVHTGRLTQNVIQRSTHLLRLCALFATNRHLRMERNQWRLPHCYILLCALFFCFAYLDMTIVAGVNDLPWDSFIWYRKSTVAHVYFLAGLPDTTPFPLKAVFVWVPEYLFPALAAKGIPCPRCGNKGNSDGWSAGAGRRLFMEHDVVYLIGFR